MEYNLHRKLIISDNAIPDRCFYIPYGKKPDNLYDFSLSDRLTLLTDWKFSYFKKFSDDIISAEASTPVKVPSVWQSYGVEPHCYLNARYPFPVDPPYILKDIPCAKYSTDYNIEKKIGKYYIDFEGVDSAYYLFVNSDYAGYSTISHCRTEFDITDKLNVGLNEITVIVLKWCSGSYLECQDKLRMSGIFREVYILNRPEGHLFDYKITTNGNDTIVFSGDKECAVRLFDRDRFIEEKTGKEVSFFIKNAKLWTAETPDLYTLEIERNGEHIYEKVGIRNISIKNAVYRINDKPVKFKGVNRHSMTVNGYVESVDDMIKDILLMKKYNINAIRTSHYPPHSFFTRLCDEYGIYVMEEADIETHGLVFERGDYNNKLWTEIACNEDFKDVIVGRTVKMYERDKNRPSVVCWSLGNEAGFSITDNEPCNFTASANALKRLDDRPIHYEGNFQYKTASDETKHVKESVLDFHSRMYASIGEMIDYANGRAVGTPPDRPFVLCEYSHAMGNSCGDVKEYWDVIYSNDIFCGGFIWEWCNHGAYDKSGKYLYGGDFGEVLHDGNFCADGLVELDRSAVHSSLLEVSEAYSPCDVQFENGKFYLVNRRDFVSLDDFDCKLTVKRNGVIIDEQKIDVSSVGAREKRILDFVPPSAEGYTTCDFTFTQREYGITNIKQIVISDDYPVSAVLQGQKCVVDNRVVFGDYKVYFGDNGLIEQIKKNGKDLLNEPMRFNIWRAPTDNDVLPCIEWRKYHFDKAYFAAKSIEYSDGRIVVDGFICYDSFLPFAKIKLSYTIDDSGKLKIDIVSDNADYINNFPRFGLTFAFIDSFDKVKYFARGEKENYEDKHAYAHVGAFECPVSEMTEKYVVPQENGAHGGARRLNIISDSARISFESNKDFSFNVTEFDERNLPKHSADLVKSGKVFVNVDYRNCGVGSNSCGPLLNEKYVISEKHIEWEIVLALE